MPNLYLAKAYLKYRRKALSKHGVHSPFVFDLVTKVFPADKTDFSSHTAEQWRSACLHDQSVINVTDFGTGTSGPRKVSAIAGRSAKSSSEGRLLYRIVKHFAPKRILELGTSLGITSNYIASATTFEKYISLEGCPETATKAGEGLANTNVQIVTGKFSDTLPFALRDLGKADMIFFDGDHREKPTLHYFETALPFVHKDSVLIFDDIHWSAEMESAWEKIKSHPKVRLTIDVFHFGLVFFRGEQHEKEHFILKF